MLKQLWGKVIEEEHSLPSYVEARSWKFFVFLLFLIKQWNNSSCASHFTLRLVFFSQTVCLYMLCRWSVPRLEYLCFILIMRSACIKTVTDISKDHISEV